MARAPKSRNLFGWLTKKQVTYSRSRGEVSHVSQAYRAGTKSGDTGAFDSWLRGKRLDSAPRAIQKRLEDSYRRGVERAGVAERVAAKKAERVAKKKAAPKSLSSYKGVRLYKLGGGEYTTALDKESRFDSLQDAKDFIGSWNKANPAGGCARSEFMRVNPEPIRKYRGATIEHLGEFEGYRVSIPKSIARDRRAATVETYSLPEAQKRIDSEFGPARGRNPQPGSMPYRLGYNSGQTDRQTASLHRTDDELTATCLAQFPERSAIAVFISGYDDGYLGAGAGELAAVENRGSIYDYEAAQRAGRERAAEIVSRSGISGRSARSIQRADNRRAINPGVNWNTTADGYIYEYKTAWGKKQYSFDRGESWYSSKAEARKVSEERGTMHKRRNPEAEPAGLEDSPEYEQVRTIASLFHGRPVKEEITVTEQIREHDWLWRIGPLVKLKIRTLTKRSATLPFHQSDEGMVHLFCSPDGRQFYLRGGDQELDLEALGMGPGTPWYRDLILIGEAKEITYRDKKKFHKFALTDYYHKLGEETRVKPMLAYDTLAKRMLILGGQYRVETEDLVDGMSPGIVN